MSRNTSLAFALALAACGEPARSTNASAPSASAPSTATAAQPARPTPAPAADSLSPLPPLTPDGWGSLRIGMTRAEVVAALGEDANPTALGGPDPADCDEFRPARAPEGVLVMVERGRLTRVSILDGAKVRTDRGVGLGDPAARVRAAYGSAVVAKPHDYVGAPAEYLVAWASAAGTPRARGILYNVGADGRVQSMFGGGGSIEYAEGCL